MHSFGMQKYGKGIQYMKLNVKSVTRFIRFIDTPTFYTTLEIVFDKENYTDK